MIAIDFEIAMFAWFYFTAPPLLAVEFEAVNWADFLFLI